LQIAIDAKTLIRLNVVLVSCSIMHDTWWFRRVQFAYKDFTKDWQKDR